MTRALLVSASTVIFGLLAAACGGGSADTGRDGVPTAPSEIGVNGFLWRASLDTLDFMPLDSADPYGGLIVTEWYANPEAPSEQFKVQVYILDSRLRADALKVSLQRRVLDPTFGWTDAQADPSSAILMENQILSRAQKLKIANLDG